MALLAHSCNPTYSGGHDQEDRFKASLGKEFHETLSQKTLHKNRAGGVAQGEGPEFKSQYRKKKKKRKKKKNGGGKRNEKILPHVPMVAG
jgi:hypothetical protein